MSTSAALWAAAAIVALGAGAAGWSRADRPQSGAELIALTTDASAYLARVRLPEGARAADGGGVRLVGPAGGLCHAASAIERHAGGDITLSFPFTGCLEPLSRGAEARLGGEVVLEDAQRVRLRLHGRVAG